MIGFIVQARLGSTRLPNKIILPFYDGKSIFELLLDKLLAFDNIKCIVATTLDPVNDILETICENYGVSCFRGDENDVLKRFIDAAEYFDVDGIIRVCSDNPFLNVPAMEELISKVSTSKMDYISFNISGTPSIKTHYGFWTEYVTISCLKKVESLTTETLYREHVTNYIYSHPESFEIEWIQVPDIILENKNVRLTIDTKDDFESAQTMYSEINDRNSFYDIFSYIREHKAIAQSMLNQIEANTK